MVEKTGRVEAIEAAQERGMNLAAQEISQKTGTRINLEKHLRGSSGGRPITSSGGSEDLQDGIGYQEPGRELSHETMSQGIGYSDRGEFFRFSLHSRISQLTLGFMRSASTRKLP